MIDHAEPRVPLFGIWDISVSVNERFLKNGEDDEWSCCTKDKAEERLKSMILQITRMYNIGTHQSTFSKKLGLPYQK